MAISGNIGSGRSTITTLLSEKLGSRPYSEVVDENPSLSDFYATMPRWSFHLQVFFLSQRFQHHQQILQASSSVIQDRTIYEDADHLDLTNLDSLVAEMQARLPSLFPLAER